MNFISTIEGIMTSQLTTWNPDEQSLADITEYAQKNSYDTIPVKRNGQIDGLLYVVAGEIKPITHDLLLSRDTPIPDALALLSASHHPAFLVLYRQEIEGILTPSDFNKVLARSYFYNLLAQLEMLLAQHARVFYSNTDDLVGIVKPDNKTVPQHRKTIRERHSSAERKNYNLDLVHSLMLEELECLVQKDEGFRKKLGFTDLMHAEQMFDGINSGFRRKVMHPVRPLLSDQIGIEQLNQYVHQVVDLITLLEPGTN
ncbi:MAG: hypothetical protein K8J31_07225 [Anaerolineae bacterium]|nr:hypothetical protein [Anaerolineae bacterium]